MDPNQGGQKPLDPNLQAAYDRVMGLDVSGNTTIPQAPTPTTQTQTPTTPAPTPVPTALPIDALSQQPTSAPSIPTLPTTPIPQQGQESAALPMPSINTPSPLPNTENAQQTTTPPPSAQPAMEPMNATINVPQVIQHDTETVTIGAGGSPVAAAIKPKGKGVSPAILILGAFVFLIVYALFWVRFFNLPLPFLSK